MSRSSFLRSIALSALILPIAPSSAFESTQIGNSELSASYAGFVSNGGGLQDIGARFRSGRFEIGLAYMSNTVAVQTGYIYRMDVAHWFIPRLALGAAFYGGIDVTPGVSFTFPLFPVGDRKHIALGLDVYLYIAVTNKAVTYPVIPLWLTYVF